MSHKYREFRHNENRSQDASQQSGFVPSLSDSSTLKLDTRPLQVRLAHISVLLNDLYLASKGSHRMVEFVDGQGQPQSADAVIRPTASIGEINALLHNPQQVQVFTDPDGRMSKTFALRFDKTLDSTVNELETWLSEDSKEVRERLIAYWSRRYTGIKGNGEVLEGACPVDGPKKVAENTQWYDGEVHIVEDMVKRLKALRDTVNGNPFETQEKTNALLYDMIGLGMELGIFNAHVSGISQIVSYSYSNKKVGNAYDPAAAMRYAPKPPAELRELQIEPRN